ncbi:uncharacterized protein LOC105838919 [Monomorium pharaonis]|uniref:uncharacterized protein LOC105838919 n=1 Tax=Monomorium pharaonis TaxID=307658 RepID=UPI00063ED94F|nr:uncharacterized protein LOC105838919 [Monomorium pharaonis]XP_036138756.1 uncharacterized protein LOC105838919 [Monomorium pharaonis]
MENERIQKEIEETDLIDLITPNEVFDTIQMYDSTIEVIGYVDSIEPSHNKEIDLKNEYFKFYLNNGNGKRVPVIAKSNNIGDNLYILRCMKLHSIVHLDGVQTIPNLEYNNGTVPYQLIIRGNSVVTNLGNYELTKPIPTKLCQVLNTSGRIMLRGYIKSNFMEIYDDKLNKLIGCGSITDGTYKLEIHIKDFSYTDYLTRGIEKGDKIKVIGIMQTDNPIYLLVNDISSIEKLDGYMSFSAMLKGICVPKRET